MARLLGEAYIAILPQTDQFGPTARAQIDKDMAAIHPTANVGAQLNKADVAKIGTQLKAISKANPVSVGVNLDKRAAAKMASDLDAYMKGHTADVGVQLSQAQLAKMSATLNSYLKGNTADVSVQLNPAQLARIKGTLDAFLKEQRGTLDYNVMPALQKMALVQSVNAGLTKFTQEENAKRLLDFNIMPALAQIATVKAAESTLGGKTSNLNVGTSNLGNTTSMISRVNQALMSLTKTEDDNSASVNRLGRGYGVWGAAISALQVHIPLFGGALDALHFPPILAQASGWHILAEAVIETAAVWGPAAIAMGVFAAASYQDTKQIVTQWQHVQTVMSATNTPMDGLTTGLTKLSQALKPDIWTAFGEGLIAIEGDSGKLTAPLQNIAHLFDVLGAHIDELVKSGGGGFAKFIQGGANDIHELGEAFGNVGKILAIFFESVPGYATILLHLGTDILGATADVLQFLQPLLKIGLAVHGAIFYLGLASTLFLTFGRNALAAGATVAETGAKVEGSGSKIANLGTGLGNLVGGFISSGKSAVNWGRDLSTAGGQIAGVTGKSKLAGMGIKLLGDAGAALADVPIAGWAIAAAAAIGVGLYFALRQTESAAAKLGDQLVSMVTNSNPNTLFTNTTKAIEANGKAIESLTTGYAKLAKSEIAAAAVGPYAPVKSTGAVGPFGSGTGKGPGPQSQPVYQPFPAAEAQQYIENFNRITQAAIPAARNELAVAKATGSMGNAISVATAIGIKWNSINSATPKQLAVIVQELKAYQQAVSYMSNSQGQAASNLAALNFAASSQIKNVQALNSAWQTYLGTVGGGENAFIGLEQGINQYNTDLKAAHATMTGLSPASLTLRSDFQQVDTAAQGQVSALTTFIAATGGATQAQKTLANQGIKAVIAQMIPLAGANKSAQAEIVALAQRANGSLTTWQAVTRWVGPKGAAGAAQTLQKVNGTLANSIKDVVSVANALTGAMQATAVAAQDKLVFALDGGAKKMAAFGNALASTNGKLTTATEKTGVEYYNALIKSGVGAETARQMVLSMAQSLGMNGTALNALNGDLIANQAQLNKQSQAARTAATDAKNLGAAFTSLATGGLKMTSQQVTALWNNLRAQDLDMVSGKADNGKTAFINFATNGLHLTTAKAQELWNALHQQGLDVLANKANTTKAQFVNLAMNGLHLTSTQAGALWNELRLQYLDTLVQKGDNAKTHFIDLAKNGLGLTQSAANSLWNTLKQQYLDTLATKAGETRSAFEKTASQFGLTKQAADNLWGSLKSLAGGSPYNVAVQELLSGSGSISAKISAAGIVLGGGGGVLTPKGANPKTNPAIGNSQDIHAAGGAFIGGNHSNVDSVHILAKPGELIVPSEHAPSVAQHLAAGGHKIPGYASGGFVATEPGIAQGAVTATKSVETDVETFAKMVNAQFSGLVSTAAQAAAGVGGAYGGPSSFGGGFESLAALVSFARYFMQNGLNAAAAAGMAATISGEEDSAGPESRNCVPLTYKVVTKRGVLAHDEVKTGDETPGYDLTTGKEVWAVILDIPYHLDADVCRIGNGHWTVDCTVDHKWITRDRSLVRADRLRMGEEVLLGPGYSERVYTFERLPNEDTFCLTTTTGTWTTVTDRDEQLWTGNSGGWGLIGWTGNTVGLPAGVTGPTGNVALDLSNQLKGVIGYMNAKGGPGPLNAAGNPVAAGQVWSRYEGPASPLSDTRASIANEIYATLVGTASAGAKAAVSTASALAASIPKITLDKGGWINPEATGNRHWGNKPHSAGGMVSEPVVGFGVNSGIPYSFAENGPEYVGPLSGDGSHRVHGMTQAQGQQLIKLLQTLATQGQQLPHNLARVQQNGLNAGMRRGTFNTGG